MTLQRKLIMLGALLGGLSVALGAFGAHALQPLLAQNARTDTYELAVWYQFYHTLVLLIIASLADRLNEKRASWAALFFTLGITVFSGSLYILALSGTTIWGAITPIGGVFLITGWVFLLLSSKRQTTTP